MNFDFAKPSPNPLAMDEVYSRVVRGKEKWFVQWGEKQLGPFETKDKADVFYKNLLKNTAAPWG